MRTSDDARKALSQTIYREAVEELKRFVMNACACSFVHFRPWPRTTKGPPLNPAGKRLSGPLFHITVGPK